MPAALPSDFYWGKTALESWQGERKRSMGASALQTSPQSVPFPLISWSSPTSCCSSSPGRLPAFKTFWQGLCIKVAPGPREEELSLWFGYSNYGIWVSSNSNPPLNMVHLFLIKIRRNCLPNTQLATGHRQDLWWWLYAQHTTSVPRSEVPGHADL